MYISILAFHEQFLISHEAGHYCLCRPLINSRTYNMVRIFGWSNLSFFLFAHARIIDNRKLNQGGEHTSKRYDHK